MILHSNPEVMNGFSETMIEMFGERNHAVPWGEQPPEGWAVEVGAIFELRITCEDAIHSFPYVVCTRTPHRHHAPKRTETTYSTPRCTARPSGEETVCLSYIVHL